MVRIATWLMSESRDEYMNVYARIRANVLMKSLNMLKEHQRTGSGGSIQGVAASPTIVCLNTGMLYFSVCLQFNLNNFSETQVPKSLRAPN